LTNNEVNRILIAMDYHPTALKVAEVGFTMAKAMNAEVVLLHVIMNMLTYSLTYLELGPLKLESVKDLEQASQEFLVKSKKHLGDNMIQTIVKDGDFAESILKTAKDLHADIIVMGSHSQRWLEEILLGSVTEKVLRQSLIPLFIIPTKHKK